MKNKVLREQGPWRKHYPDNQSGPAKALPPPTVTFDVPRKFVLLPEMIKSYRGKRTEDFAKGKRVPAFQGFKRQGDKRLKILDAATSLSDLAALPGNRFEALKGDRKGRYAIAINMQWRICFDWSRGSDGPENMETIDYHKG